MSLIASLLKNPFPVNPSKVTIMETLGFPAINGLLAGIIAIIFGVVILAVPRILNYIIAAVMIVTGILWISGGSLLPGIVSILFGIIVIIFPTVLNYVVAVYLILLGLWLWIFASSMIAGIITLAAGIVVLIVPSILNYIFALYLIVAGFLAIGHYYGWF